MKEETAEEIEDLAAHCYAGVTEIAKAYGERGEEMTYAEAAEELLHSDPDFAARARRAAANNEFSQQVSDKTVVLFVVSLVNYYTKQLEAGKVPPWVN